MRFFKNRGDIYIPKTDYKKSKEERILRILLIFIIVFTVAFIAVLSHKYSSAADFFGRGEIKVTETNKEGKEYLPDISGKTNFLVFETDFPSTFPSMTTAPPRLIRAWNSLW